MSVNIGIFKTGAFDDQYSVDKQPYQVGYDPIFGGETFNATDGEAKNKVVFLHEIHATNNYYYTSVQVSPVELAPFQRDPDRDTVNEWRVFIAQPIETIVLNESVGTGNNVAQEFDLARRWVKPGTEVVRLGGTVQPRNISYWINYSTGHIRFATPPASGIAITVDYTHGDAGNGTPRVPADHVIELNGDWIWTSVWDIPHGHDANRGVGHERDGIAVVVRGRVDPGTTDPEGNAITLFQQQIRVKGWEHNARL